MWFLVPETKGRTLEEMDELFGVAGMVEDEKLKESIEREIGLYALLGGESDVSDSPHKTNDEANEKVQLEKVEGN